MAKEKSSQSKTQIRRKQEFTQPNILPTAALGKQVTAPHEVVHNENNLKRRRMFVDLIELQHYGGLALCSNHIVNFKIGK